MRTHTAPLAQIQDDVFISCPYLPFGLLLQTADMTRASHARVEFHAFLPSVATDENTEM